MAQIQVIQAEAQVASAEQALLNAEVQWRSQELAFKSLLITGADDPLLYQTVNPVGFPSIEEGEGVDIEAAIQIALSERTDIQQQRFERRIAQSPPHIRCRAPAATCSSVGPWVAPPSWSAGAGTSTDSSRLRASTSRPGICH